MGNLNLKREEIISDTVLPLEGRILEMKRLDLYNKSRVSREVQVRLRKASGQ
jgi:hypothetical protein